MTFSVCFASLIRTCISPDFSEESERPIELHDKDQVGHENMARGSENTECENALSAAVITDSTGQDLKITLDAAVQTAMICRSLGTYFDVLCLSSFPFITCRALFYCSLCIIKSLGLPVTNKTVCDSLKECKRPGIQGHVLSRPMLLRDHERHHLSS